MSAKTDAEYDQLLKNASQEVKDFVHKLRNANMSLQGRPGGGLPAADAQSQQPKPAESANLQAEVARLNALVAKQKTEIQSLLQTNMELSAPNQGEDSVKQTLRAQLKTLREQAQVQQTELASLRGERDQLRATASELTMQIQVHQKQEQQASGLGELLNQQKKIADDLREENEEMRCAFESQYTQLQCSHDQLEAELAAANERFMEQEHIVEELKGQLAGCAPQRPDAFLALLSLLNIVKQYAAGSQPEEICLSVSTIAENLTPGFAGHPAGTQHRVNALLQQFGQTHQHSLKFVPDFKAVLFTTMQQAADIRQKRKQPVAQSPTIVANHIQPVQPQAPAQPS